VANSGDGNPSDERGDGIQPAPASPFASTVLQPALIWGCCASGDALHVSDTLGALDRSNFHWLHLNLADQRTLRWLTTQSPFPAPIQELLLSRDSHPRVVVEESAVGIVLQDFERGLQSGLDAEIGALHLAVSSGLIVTGRYHPLRSADVVRQRLTRATTLDRATALTLIFDAMSGLLSSDVRELGLEVQTCEDDLLNASTTSGARAIMLVRRRGARLHRLVGGMRAVLHRLENDPDTPEALQPVAERFAQRLDSIEADIMGAQSQMRMLRDEIDLEAAQHTNETLYFLSVINALLLPATLVTGFFGMNTGGLPFAHGWAGTAAAALIALLASGTTWMLLHARR
jgi:zinc transporter